MAYQNDRAAKSGSAKSSSQTHAGMGGVISRSFIAISSNDGSQVFSRVVYDPTGRGGRAAAKILDRNIDIDVETY